MLVDKKLAHISSAKLSENERFLLNVDQFPSFFRTQILSSMQLLDIYIYLLLKQVTLFLHLCSFTFSSCSNNFVVDYIFNFLNVTTEEKNKIKIFKRNFLKNKKNPNQQLNK